MDRRVPDTAIVYHYRYPRVNHAGSRRILVSLETKKLVLSASPSAKGLLEKYSSPVIAKLLILMQKTASKVRHVEVNETRKNHGHDPVF